MILQIKKLLFLTIIFILGVCKAQYKENDWAKRDTWMNVEKIFELAEIAKGDVVADLGCHEGYLTIHMSKQVGREGKVYAVDVRKDRLDQLDEHLKKRKLNNVKTILGDYDNPKLPYDLLDVVIVMDTYHEIEQYMKVLAHIKNSLKPDGSVVIIEKFKSHLLNKTRAEQIDAHTLSMNYVKTELLEAGFSIQKEIKNFGEWKNDPDKKIWILIGVPTIR